MSRAITLSVGLLTALVAGTTLAGPLDPPAGPVASTFKTLTEVEPRTAIGITTTPGDSDATPSMYKITQSGSYYLTSNVNATAGKYGIEVAASDVSIDLNGFTIKGGTTGIVCLGGLRSISVRNGTISGTSDYGLRTNQAEGGVFENLTVRDTVSGGLSLGEGVVVRNCTVQRASTGIWVRSNSVVRDSVVRDCTSIGFQSVASDSNTRFERCSAIDNAGDGFDADYGLDVTFVDCTSNGNAGYGFDCGSRTTVERCKASQNAKSGVQFDADSICRDSEVIGNGTGGSSLSGIVLSGNGNTIERCRLMNNAGSGIYVLVTAVDNVIIGNWMKGNAGGGVNYPVGNEVGAIVTNPGLNAFGTANPFSNFVY